MLGAKSAVVDLLGAGARLSANAFVDRARFTAGPEHNEQQNEEGLLAPPADVTSGLMVEMLSGTSEEKIALPDAFDAREKWPECKDSFRILDQGSCGSCWAFGSTAAFQDRFCIANGGSVVEHFSVQEMLDCTWTTTNGCRGGYHDEAYYYLKRKGLGSEQCEPYTPGNPTWETRAERCFKARWQSGRECRRSVQKFSEVYSVGDPSMSPEEIVRAMQEELFLRGPVSVQFYVFDDFQNYYASGVYSRTRKAQLVGGHLVKLVGWGTSDDGEDFWLAANSWGTDWGDDGYFKIRRGVNECGIEDEVAAGKI